MRWVWCQIQSWNVEAGLGRWNKGDIDSGAPTAGHKGWQRANWLCRKEGRERVLWNNGKRGKQSGKKVQRAEIPSCKQQTPGLCTIIFPLSMFRCIHAVVMSRKEVVLAERKPWRDGEKAVSVMKSIRPRSLRESRFDDTTVYSTWRLLAEGWEWRGGKGVMAEAARGTLVQVSSPPEKNKKKQITKIWKRKANQRNQWQREKLYT